MSTLVANGQFDDFYQYIDGFRLESLYQDANQIETALSGSFSYKKISTAQMVVGSSGDIVVVDGTGLTIPVGSLLNGSDSNLSWSNVGGTLQDVQIYQGGSFQGSSVTGGTELLDAAFSPTQYSITYGGNEVVFTGSGFPTDVASIGALLQGTYNGANFNVSSVMLESGGKSVSLSLTSSAYTVTAGDYKAVLTGTGLPTSFSASFIEQLLQGESPLSIGGSITGIDITQISTGATVLSESGAAPITLDTLLSGQEQLFTALLSNVSSVQASSADISDVFDRLNTLVSAGTLTSIAFTDTGTPVLTLTGQQLYDTAALGKLSGNYDLVVNGASAYQIETLLAKQHLTSFSIADYAQDLVNQQSAVEDAEASGKLTGITLLDSGTPNIILEPLQVTEDATVLQLIPGNYTVSLDGDGGGAIQGVPGHGTVLDVYYPITLTPTGDGSSFKLTFEFGTDMVSGVTAIQSPAGLDFVAQTPGSGSTVTTGNITELYSAVLAREPDVAGLAFYQNYLKANPATPLTAFATYFLTSGEYTGNSAHNYAVSSAGDAKFIADSYQNLLGRTPTASEVSFYQTNVMAAAESGLTPGTQAFANAQLQAHALMLVYFSNSAEFLNDVQITAQHPADAQHWLYLI